MKGWPENLQTKETTYILTTSWFHCEKVQNQLLNERVRPVPFTIDALKETVDHILRRVISHLPSPFLEKVSEFIEKVQLSHHTENKERKAHKNPSCTVMVQQHKENRGTNSEAKG